MAESWRRATVSGPYGGGGSPQSRRYADDYSGLHRSHSAHHIDASAGREGSHYAHGGGLSPTRLRLMDEEVRAAQRLAVASSSAALQASHGEIDMLRIDNANLRREANDAKGQYAAAAAERQVLRRQVEELSLAKECEASSGRHDRGMLLDENRQLKDDAARLRDQLLASRHEQSAMERTVADLRAELVQNNRVLVDQNETVRALTHEMSRRNPAQLVKYQRESQSDAATISDLTRRLTEAVAERDRAFGDVRRLEADMRLAKEDAAHRALVAKQRLEEALRSNVSDEAFAAKLKAQRDRDAAEVEAMRNEYERRIVALQSERAGLDAALREAKEEAGRLKRTYEGEVKRLEGDVAAARSQVADASEASLIPITVGVHSCRGLIDMGPTDATVVVYDSYSNKVMTTVVTEGTNPRFDAERTKTVRVPERSSHSAFTVDVFHFVNEGTAHQFLGRAIVPLRDMVAVEDGTMECRLLPREGETDPLITKARSLGYVTLKIGRPGRVKRPAADERADRGVRIVDAPPAQRSSDDSVIKPQKPPVPPQTGDGKARGVERGVERGVVEPPKPKPAPIGDQNVSISIISGTHLLSRDSISGKSDPFVIVYDTTGAKRYQTPVISNSLNPAWTGAVAYITVPASGEGFVGFEVWDDDFGSANEVMGYAKLSAKTILEATSGTHVLQLGPRDKETDSTLLKAKSLGSITVSVMKVEAQNANTNRREVVDEVATTDPKTIVLSDEEKFMALRGGIQEVLIYVRGCSNVLDMDAVIGSRGSDVFVTVLDTANKEVKRTPVVTSLNPQWPIEKASVRLALDPADNGFITFEAWDEDVTFNDFLGLVTISPTVILAKGSHKATYDLQPRPNEKNGAIKKAIASGVGLGKIHLEFTVSDASTRAPTGGEAPAALGGMYDVVSRIYSASGLLARDTWGSSDPFVMVYDGADDTNLVLKTKPIKNNCNPQFPDGTVTRPFRISSGGGDRDMIRFEVWDEDLVSNDFLGEARVTVSEIIANFGGKPFPVTLRPRLKENDKTILKHHDQLGRIVLSFSNVTSADDIAAFNAQNAAQSNAAPKPAVEMPKEPRECNIYIPRCNGLLDRDDIGGHSDPYVKVYHVAATGGKTTELFNNIKKYVDDNPNPTWPIEDASFNFTAYPNDEGALRFEVWDKDLTGSDFLGCVTIPVKSFVDKSFDGERIIQLTARDNEKEKDILKNIDNLGTITVSVKTGAAPIRAPPKVAGEIPKQEAAVIRKVCVVVESASNLVDVEGTLATGVSDPFVIVKQGPKELLRTPSVDNDLNPKWPRNQSSFNFTANSTDDIPLTFWVYDENTIGSNTFMGTASLSIADVAIKGNIRHQLPLQLSANAKDNSSKLRKGDGNLGTLFVTIFDEDGSVGKGDAAAAAQLAVIAKEKAAVEQAASAKPAAPILQKDVLLSVWVKGLDGIVNTDATIFSSKDLTDAYIMIMGPNGKLCHTCPEVPDSLSPRWDKSKGSVQIPVTTNSGQSITFRVFDANKIQKNEEFAEITVSVDEALKHIGEDWRQKLKCNNKKYDKQDPGTITFFFDY